VWTHRRKRIFSPCFVLPIILLFLAAHQTRLHGTVRRRSLGVENPTIASQKIAGVNPAHNFKSKAIMCCPTN
jgi:hypothetical protein